MLALSRSILSTWILLLILLHLYASLSSHCGAISLCPQLVQQRRLDGPSIFGLAFHFWQWQRFDLVCQVSSFLIQYHFRESKSKWGTFSGLNLIILNYNIWTLFFFNCIFIKYNNYKIIKPPKSRDQTRDIKNLIAQISWMIHISAFQISIYNN